MDETKPIIYHVIFFILLLNVFLCIKVRNLVKHRSVRKIEVDFDGSISAAFNMLQEKILSYFVGKNRCQRVLCYDLQDESISWDD